MDGGYDPLSARKRLLLATLVRGMGLQASILGFSFNRHPDAAVVADFRQLRGVRLLLRDSRSKEAFVASTGREDAVSCADLAFLIRAASDVPEAIHLALEWQKKARSEVRLVIGVNINRYPFSVGKRREEIAPFDKAISKTLNILMRQHQRTPLPVLLVANDMRYSLQPGSDINATIVLETGLQSVGIDVHRLHPHYNAEELTAVLGGLDFILTGRMHLAIMGLTQKVPSLAISYQDKFEGMYQHLGSPLRYVVIMPEVYMSDRAEEIFSCALERRLETRQRIDQALPVVQALAKKNLVIDNLDDSDFRHVRGLGQQVNFHE
jgi:polysaccharide pyruvyl transferase WcaK-like protein